MAMQMISAEEAKRETEKYISDRCKEELNGIYRQIEDAIRHGQFAIHRDGYINEMAENLLIELGYYIKKDFTNNEASYCISWR